ncbi:MAG: hypothetical protein K0R68_1540, partial [Mycobacterium sp.]|nr:hypothetical protein [Mycobacterium sp.]
AAAPATVAGAFPIPPMPDVYKPTAHQPTVKPTKETTHA